MPPVLQASGKGKVETGLKLISPDSSEAAELQYVFSRGKALIEKGQVESQGNFFHHPMILADVKSRQNRRIGSQ
jgi:hypothetical protein